MMRWQEHSLAEFERGDIASACGLCGDRYEIERVYPKDKRYLQRLGFGPPVFNVTRFDKAQRMKVFRLAATLDEAKKIAEDDNKRWESRVVENRETPDGGA